jgi:hypothetical protein
MNTRTKILKELASSLATLVGSKFELTDNGLLYPSVAFKGVMIEVGDDTLVMDFTITATDETYLYANIEQCGYLGSQLFACINSSITGPSYREQDHEVSVGDIPLYTTTFSSQKTALVENLLELLTKGGVRLIAYAVARNVKRAKFAQAKASRKIKQDAEFIEALRDRFPYLTPDRARKLAAVSKEFTKNEADAGRLAAAIVELG